MRIRVRGPSGQSTLTLEESSTVGDLKKKLAEATSLSSFTVKTGIPPQPLEDLELDAYSDDTTLNDASLKLANSMLIVSAKEGSNPSAAAAASTPQPKSMSSSTHNQPTTRSKQPPGGMLNLEKKKMQDLADPPEVLVPEWGLNLMLRVMPDDNSCLFRALGACVLSSEIDSATELRDVVASAIQRDPETYNAAILGMSPDSYCAKIKTPDTWGGEIEIQIIAGEFNIGVDAIDVETGKVYPYNQEATSRCIIIYSGVHYDTVALGGPGVPDVKQFALSEYEPIKEKAIEICQILKGRHYYTNTTKFSIMCGDCGWKGAGEKAAQEHFAKTNHFNFKET
jgi:ubiquitin thioesterase OTU1